MTSLPINDLIHRRIKELELTRSQAVARLGYRNISKGLRSLDRVCAGEMDQYPSLMQALGNALELTETEVLAAVAETHAALTALKEQRRAEEEAMYRRDFKPHAVILTVNSRPSPIFVVALTGINRILRVKIDCTQPRETWLDQARKAVPDMVLGFGKTAGVVMDYSPDEAVQLDFCTGIQTKLTKARRVGQTWLTVQGRDLTVPIKQMGNV